MSDTTRQYTLATNNDGSGKVKIGLIPERTIPYADHLKELEELRERNRYLLDENDRLESAVSAHEGEAAYALERSALLAAANVELQALRAQLRSKDEQSAGMRKAKTLCQCGHEKSIHDSRRRYPCAVCYCSGFFSESPAQEGTE